MQAVVVMNHVFLVELLRQMGIDEKNIGDITMEWAISGVLTLTIKAMPSKEHLDAACRAYMGNK